MTSSLFNCPTGPHRDSTTITGLNIRIHDQPKFSISSTQKCDWTNCGKTNRRMVSGKATRQLWRQAAAASNGKQFLLEQLSKDKPKNRVEASCRGKHSGLDCLPSACNRSAWYDIKVLIFGIFCVFYYLQNLVFSFVIILILIVCRHCEWGPTASNQSAGNTRD